ncbi:MAG: hypothetical protein HYU88_03140 [Chloroflexi bacterium]|nr:hypothetical protein [Chloroflexota bacterium]MBI4505912.1 hypothetical protein [Chloroflexota bacterium]
MSSSARAALASVLVFAAGLGLWFSAGILRGIAHVAKLPIEPALDVVLYLGFFAMVVGLVLTAVFVPRWHAARQR